MIDYPLYFRFSVPVQGSAFVAIVDAQGRAVAHEEATGWWIDVVEPGSVAEGGHNLHAAFDEFRATFCGALFDFAAGAESFEHFERQAREFFAQVDEGDLDRWSRARAAARSGAFAGIEGLRREKRERPTEITVLRVDLVAANSDLGPDKNRVDELKSAA